jgi:dye decolorizing peroxidase
MHQAGIDTAQQRHTALLALTLRVDTDRAALGRLLRAWTGTLAALTAGRPAPGDPNPHLAAAGARLTGTVAVGPRAIAVAGRDPAEVDLVIPAFAIDRLQPRYGGGDLLVQVCADDATSVSHTVRVLQRDAAPFAITRWVQRGFSGVRPDGRARNLMGQVEGTGNPAPGTALREETVWRGDGPAWLRGGTTMAVRRIRLDLAAWERVDPDGQDRVIGRRTTDGAALGATGLDEAPDFTRLATAVPGHSHATDQPHEHAPVGLAIPDDAHIRRAHRDFTGGRRILRRGYNFDDADPASPGAAEAGLLFISFQADLDAFVGIQRSLAASDALNRWSTPVGSAAFAVLPGVAPGDWLGRSLVAG